MACRIGLVRDHHLQDQRAAVAAGCGRRLDEARHAWADEGRLVDAAAAAEIVVSVLRSEPGTGVALRGADDRDLCARQWQAAAVVHLKKVALESECPACQSSRMIVTYSAQYSY